MLASGGVLTSVSRARIQSQRDAGGMAAYLAYVVLIDSEKFGLANGLGRAVNAKTRVL